MLHGTLVNRLRVAPHEPDRDGPLLLDIKRTLREHPELAREEIAVSTRNGVVTLEGRVSTRARILEAELACWSVGGVGAIVNRLRAA